MRRWCHACGRPITEECAAFGRDRPAWPHPRRWSDPVPVIAVITILALLFAAWAVWNEIAAAMGWQ